MEGELVSRQMRALADMENSGVVPMLQQDKYADLARMYGLFRRVEGGLDLLRTVRHGIPPCGLLANRGTPHRLRGVPARVTVHACMSPGCG